MAPSVITYEEAKEIIGTLPSVAPRPNASNLRVLAEYLEQKVQTIPAPQQSPEYGYLGMVQPAAIYALRTNTPWIDWNDPGPHPGTADTTAEQNNLRTMYEANKAVYDSQQNVRRAITDALNIAIPNAFRKPAGNQMGTKVFTVRDNPRDILDGLRAKYGTCSPNEKTANNQRFDQPWDPNEPIEALFDRLEECYIFSILAKPPFTLEQLIDKAIIAIQRTALYETALLEWQGFDDANKTWEQLKLHFEEAYEIRLASGQGTAATHGYVNNAEVADDDSLSSIHESLQSIHLANNANYQSLQDHLQAARAETATLRAELQATQQNFAHLAQAAARAPPAPVPPVAYAPNVAPPAAYIPAPTQYAPPPQYQQYTQQSYGRGRGRRNNNRRGARRSTTAYQPPTTTGVPPVPNTVTAAGGYIPPPTISNAGAVDKPAFSNTTKYFNNWNMCFSCGWDVPHWHSSQTCPYRVDGHQVGCTRENAQAYMSAGHRVSHKAMHKTSLPQNPGPNQA